MIWTDNGTRLNSDEIFDYTRDPWRWDGWEGVFKGVFGYLEVRHRNNRLQDRDRFNRRCEKIANMVVEKLVMIDDEEEVFSPWDEPVNEDWGHPEL